MLRPLFVSLLAASTAAGCAGDSGDGRVFLFLGDASSNNYSTTAVYELEPSGRATRRFEALGDVIQWLRVR